MVLAVMSTSITSFAAVDIADYLTSEYGYELYGETLNVEKAKEFNIVFSKDLDSESTGGIQMVEKGGEGTAVAVETYMVSTRQLKVVPKEDLNVGSSYYLIIHSPDMAQDAVSSSEGEALKSGVVCEFFVQGEYIYDAKAEGKVATAITGKVKDADRVLVEYDGKTKTALLENGEFTWNVFPSLDEGTQVTISAYSGSSLLEQLTIESQ